MIKKRIVIALGGNAMLKRGEVLSAENQYKNIKTVSSLISQLSDEYAITIVHGNGPQVGLLALQDQAYAEVPSYPLDVLVAETQGMIGYMIAQSLTQYGVKDVSCLLTRVSVDANDPAFEDPTKFIGPVYAPSQQKALEQQYGWQMKADGEYVRRVVASPFPQKVIEAKTISHLLDNGELVVCCGGGGMPVVGENEKQTGVEAVIDKDLVASMLAKQLKADHLLILTDADAVYVDWGTVNQRALRDVTSSQMKPFAVPDGAMGPKAESVISFVEATGNVAFIGALQDVEAILAGEKGTCIRPELVISPAESDLLVH
ncbi:carbamate kinase [Photobacterium minamisatsumaniensis]|uniref:carbamate kinase n=1 Tax=Photobacterium minamisatsumaniensis TaxID=2910233 RepID=UPI003D0D50EB